MPKNYHLNTLRTISVVELVENIIDDAIAHRASDIHIEPSASDYRIRFRCDGLLVEVKTIPQALAAQIIIRLKVMALLDIAESRLPQDGRIQLARENEINIRLSTCPTIYGEKIALRLLDASRMKFDIAALGLNIDQQQLFMQKLALPQGLILVTGPTGSGKTITLYAALHWLNQIEKNIMTVEDPIEIKLAGINQVAVNQKIGLDFATVLRAFLRQDPDIIMIGEIRDRETAHIAIQAAQTGHLVLSTLHTNNAEETFVRFQAMDINIQHFTHAVSLIVAQRLVRKLCQACQGKTCDQCYRGYQGRTAIFELLDPTHASTPSQHQLWQAGLEKVTLGITTRSELISVLGRQH